MCIYIYMSYMCLCLCLDRYNIYIWYTISNLKRQTGSWGILCSHWSKTQPQKRSLQLYPGSQWEVDDAANASWILISLSVFSSLPSTSWFHAQRSRWVWTWFKICGFHHPELRCAEKTRCPHQFCLGPINLQAHTVSLTLPSEAAKCSGLRPLVLRRLIPAPECNKSFTTCGCPSCAAACKGLVPASSAGQKSTNHGVRMGI